MLFFCNKSKAFIIVFCFLFIFSCASQSADNSSIIHIETFGKGAPVLIINGGPGMNSEGFKPLAKTLAKHNKAIIYDQRGTGMSTLSSVNSRTVTLDLMAKDIETIRDSLNIENWFILGHSFGGMLASYYASKFPDKIKGMVLSSSGGLDLELFNALNITSNLSNAQIDSLNYYTQRIQKGDTSYQTRYNRGKLLAPAYLYHKKHRNIVAHRLTQVSMRINQLVFQDMRKIDFNVSDDLKSFNKPVLIIQGKQDIIPISIAKKMHGVFPNSELILLDKCGHYGWLDQPKNYFATLHEFLTEE